MFMRSEDKTEVLVVGAGPVGMFTALLLAENGLEVKIVEQASRTTARSYACALHPRTLTLFGQAGLADDVIKLGQRVERMAFYEGDSQRAEINLAGLSGDYPFLLVLPQSALEGVLEERLRRKAGIQIEWNHRLSNLQQERQEVLATVEKLGGTGTGYIVPHWETVVKKTLQTRASFVV